MFEVGEKAMMVIGGYRIRSAEYFAVTVKAVHKNGTVLLDGHDKKFRKDGSETTKSAWSGSGLHTSLRKWDEAEWLAFQERKQRAEIAARLYSIGAALQKASNNPEMAKKIWDKLPDEIRDLPQKGV